MAGLVPAIHAFLVLKKTWMPGTSSAKTRFALLAGHDDEVGEDGKEQKRQSSNLNETFSLAR
jgi:hypothetical protein